MEFPEPAAAEAAAIQSMTEANRILAEAGWRPIQSPAWGMTFTAGRLVGGVAPNGTQYVKALDAVKPGDPRYGPDTPDEHHEAAAWLVQHVRGPAITPVREIALEGGAQPDSETEEIGLFDQENPAETTEEVYDSGGAEPERESVLDADFTESAGDAYDEALTLALEGPESVDYDALEHLGSEPNLFEDDRPAEQSGPIAYMASDLDALVREKLGRVSQIARELKALLQDGWTLDEFASLQNLIVRIDRQEAPDDRTARARFQAISERSQAMSRVDSHRDGLEADLEAIGIRRDYAATVAFNPEEGWPDKLQ